MGSGTTGRVCDRLGRSFVGYDLNGILLINPPPIIQSCNNIFTPKIKSIMLATNVLKSGKNKKEVKNDLLSMLAPPSTQSCITNQHFCVYDYMIT